MVPAMKSPPRMRSRLKQRQGGKKPEQRQQCQLLPGICARSGRQQQAGRQEHFDLAGQVAGEHRRRHQRRAASVDHPKIIDPLPGVAPCQASSKYTK